MRNLQRKFHQPSRTRTWPIFWADCCWRKWCSAHLLHLISSLQSRRSLRQARPKTSSADPRRSQNQARLVQPLFYPCTAEPNAQIHRVLKKTAELQQLQWEDLLQFRAPLLMVLPHDYFRPRAEKKYLIVVWFELMVLSIKTFTLTAETAFALGSLTGFGKWLWSSSLWSFVMTFDPSRSVFDCTRAVQDFRFFRDWSHRQYLTASFFFSSWYAYPLKLNISRFFVT